jgi:hypothetical protein
MLRMLKAICSRDMEVESEVVRCGGEDVRKGDSLEFRVLARSARIRGLGDQPRGAAVPP